MFFVLTFMPYLLMNFEINVCLNRIIKVESIMHVSEFCLVNITHLSDVMRRCYILQGINYFESFIYL